MSCVCNWKLMRELYRLSTLRIGLTWGFWWRSQVCEWREENKFRNMRHLKKFWQSLVLNKVIVRTCDCWQAKSPSLANECWHRPQCDLNYGACIRVNENIGGLPDPQKNLNSQLSSPWLHRQTSLRTRAVLISLLYNHCLPTTGNCNIFRFVHYLCYLLCCHTVALSSHVVGECLK